MKAEIGTGKEIRPLDHKAASDGWQAREEDADMWLAGMRLRPRRLAKEHYLREDIPCGSALCEECPLAPGCPSWLSATASHYAIPDELALLRHAEFWEVPEICNIIFLASVFKELLLLSDNRTLSRMWRMATDRRKESTHFDDVHSFFVSLRRKDLDGISSETAAKAKKNPITSSGSRPTPLLAASGWFADHLGNKMPIVVVSDRLASPQDRLASSQDPLLRSLPEAVLVLSAKAYFEVYWGHNPDIAILLDSLDRVAAPPTAGPPDLTAAEPKFTPYISVLEVEDELEAGDLYSGVVQVSQDDPSQVIVRCGKSSGGHRLDIRIPSGQHLNRAMHGDKVAVRLIQDPAAELQAHTPERGAGEGRDGTDDVGNGLHGAHLADLAADGEVTRGTETGSGDEAATGVEWVGEVVAVLRRQEREYVVALANDVADDVAALHEGREDSGRAADCGPEALCVPLDPRFPSMRLASRHLSLVKGQHFVVRLDSWPLTAPHPCCHLVRTIGALGQFKTLETALLVEYGISMAPFTNGALAELPQHSEQRPWQVPPEEVAARRDLRGIDFAGSIDPPGSKDVDDVLSVHRPARGLLEFGVHIADVSFFVQPQSFLDAEAKARSTTSYMMTRRLDMLPATLSETVCSLVGGEDRLAVSVVWTVDAAELAQGRVKLVDTWFGRAVIHSQQQMTYAQAQAISDGVKELPEEWKLRGGKGGKGAKTGAEAAVHRVKENLNLLAQFARVLHEGRHRLGALDLKSSELRFDYDANGEPVDLRQKSELQMNDVIAELMIFANSCVARRILKTFPTCSLLRNHALPRPDGFEALKETAAAAGIHFPSPSSLDVARTLQYVRGLRDPDLELAVSSLATRSLSEAQYVSSGSPEVDSFSHYGLAIKYYTHFTSPIRRYADVVVHRMLMRALEFEGRNPAPRGEANDLIHLRLSPPAGGGGDGRGVAAAQWEVGGAYVGEGSKPSVGPAWSPSELDELAHHINVKHRNAKVAQKRASELTVLWLLASRRHAGGQPMAERAVVMSVEGEDVRVLIPKYDMEAALVFKHGKDLKDQFAEERGPKEPSLRPLQRVQVGLEAERVPGRWPKLTARWLPKRQGNEELQPEASRKEPVPDRASEGLGGDEGSLGDDVWGSFDLSFAAAAFQPRGKGEGRTLHADISIHDVVQHFESLSLDAGPKPTSSEERDSGDRDADNFVGEGGPCPLKIATGYVVAESRNWSESQALASAKKAARLKSTARSKATLRIVLAPRSS